MGAKILTDEDENEGIKYRIFAGIMLFLSGVIFILVLYCTYKFYSVFKLRKKLQFTFLIGVVVSALARTVFFFGELLWRSENCTKGPGVCVEGSISWLGAEMFSTAVVINIFNWIYQTLRLDKFLTGRRRNQIFWHVLFISTNLIFIGQYIGLLVTAGGFNKGYGTGFNVFGYIYGITFGVIATAFAIVGINFYRKYKVVSKQRALKSRKRIFSSIIIIFLCFMTRGVFTIMIYAFRLDEGQVHDLLNENSIVFPIILFLFYIIVDMVPTIYLGLAIKWLGDEYLNNRQRRTKLIDRVSTAGFSDLYGTTNSLQGNVDMSVPFDA